MITTRIVRYLSTRTVVDKWFNALQSPTHDEQQSKLAECIEYSLQQDQSNYSNVVKDIIHRWAIEHPTKEALWTYEINGDTYQKLTFNDIHTQSSHFATVLTGHEFGLTAGQNVLVVLPSATKERSLIQLACLQSSLIFCSSDPKYLTENDIRQQIRSLAIDCIITNKDYLEMIMNCTHNSLRPLKKGLLSHCSISEPLPIGWHHLTHNINNHTERKYLKADYEHSTKRFLRHLFSDIPVNQHYQSIFSLRQLLIAYWLNMNKLPCLIWIKEDKNKISLAPWLLGSTIFYRETDNIQTIFNTIEKYSIDTFCATQNDYQILNKQQPPQQQITNSHLKQLLSIETILDPMIKSRWYSLTNLYIQDDCIVISANLNDTLNVQSILKSFINPSEYKQYENISTTDPHKLPIPQL